MITLTERQWGWVAGILDGEGSLSLVLYNGTGPGVGATLSVGNTCEPMIHRLHIWFGGAQRKTSYQHRYAGSELPVRKRTYFWTVSDRTLLSQLLPQVVDLLTEKQERAYLMLEFLKHCPMNPGQALSPYEVQTRREYWEMMRELNRKGPVG